MGEEAKRERVISSKAIVHIMREDGSLQLDLFDEYFSQREKVRETER